MDLEIKENAPSSDHQDPNSDVDSAKCAVIVQAPLTGISKFLVVQLENVIVPAGEGVELVSTIDGDKESNYPSVPLESEGVSNGGCQIETKIEPLIFKEDECEILASLSQEVDHRNNVITSPRPRRAAASKKLFRCTDCEASFVIDYQLKNHVRLVHKSGQTFKCDKCGEAFASKALLSKHSETHTGSSDSLSKSSRHSRHIKTHPNSDEDALSKASRHSRHIKTWSDLEDTPSNNPGNSKGSQTDIASNGMPSKSTHSRKRSTKILDSDPDSDVKGSKHMSDDSDLKSPLSKCEICNGYFKRVKNHIKDVHSGKKRFKCNQCGKDFNRESDLRRHSRIHSGEKPHHCAECGRYFSSENGYNGHMRQHRGETPFKCHYCDKSFPLSGNLIHHLRIHTKCPRCPQQFQTLKQRDEHLSTHKPMYEQEKYTVEKMLLVVFTCIKCKKKFSNLKLLKAHMQRHSKEKFRCVQCEKGFESNQLLNDHMNRHHTGETPYLCGLCGQAFSAKAGLMYHMKVHGAEKQFKCDKCYKSFLFKARLERHMQTHTEERPYLCNECGKSFTLQHYLNVHMRTHSGDKPFKCQECGKSFNSKTSLYTHALRHTSQRTVKCNVCGKAYFSKINLTAHMKVHAQQGPYQCDKCGKKFRIYKTLQKHALAHVEGKPFNCSECDLSWQCERTYNEHLQAHKSGQKPFTCDICGDKFVTRKSLIKHIATHPKEMLLRCDLCWSVFKFRDCLSRHMIRIHKIDPSTVTATDGTSHEKLEGEKVYTCDQCGKSFNNGKSLFYHERAHKMYAKEKSFQCSECGKCFRFNHLLNKHIRNHTGDKPFSCTICEKKFIRKYELKNHMLTRHSSERPYQCPICGKGFGIKSRMNWHAKRHDDANKPYRCGTCGRGFLCQSELALHSKRHKSGPRMMEKRATRIFAKRVTLPSGETRYEYDEADTVDRPYKCDICGKAYRLEYALRWHMKIHTGDMPFKCEACDETFRCRSELTRHISMKHCDREPELFPCGICNKHLSSEMTLRDHIKIHMGEREFLCKVCNKGFVSQSKLNWHIKGQHSGARPFPCPHCEKSYIGSSELIVHLRVHTGERPFKCGECGKGFTAKGQLKKHSRVHARAQAAIVDTTTQISLSETEEKTVALLASWL